MEKHKVKYGAIIEARMGSSRLPGKTLKDLSGEPLIKRVYDRVNCSDILDIIVLAMSDNPKDDVLENYALKHNIKYFRGSEKNVLKRVLYAAKKFSIKNIVELHGDNPFLDPNIIDSTIKIFDDNCCDYISNTIEKTFPMGLRVQVFSTQSLEYIYHNVNDPAVNEHVSLYYYENPDKYKIKNVIAPENIRRPEIRLTIDTLEDYVLACKIYKIIMKKGIFPNFKTKDLIDIIDKYNIPLINIDVKSKSIR